MRQTFYKLEIKKLTKKLRIALISDLHGRKTTEIVSILSKAKPDIILAPGDICERIDKSLSKNKRGFELLSSAARIAPTFYSLGNHEIGGTKSWAMPLRRHRPLKARWSEENQEKLNASGAVLLDDAYVLFDGLAIGGLTSGILNDDGAPELSWLGEFCRAGCPKILLCHHPEYYEKYLRDYDIDLIVAGHAHGGQWRFFGRGVFAPGQGLFPKYTKGIYEGRLVVGTGLKGGDLIPRIFNSPEVVFIDIN